MAGRSRSRPTAGAPATGARPRRLTRAKGAAASPSFSPDGRWVAYAGHEHGEAGASKHTHILLVRPSGILGEKIAEKV